MSPRTLAAVAVTALPLVVHAQALTPDSLLSARRELGRQLAPAVFWRDRPIDSGVDQCQQRFPTFCVAEHNIAPAGETRFPGGYPAAAELFLASARYPAQEGTLQKLEELSRTAPDNGWFVGQLAHIATLVGDTAAALRILEDCRGTRAWCAALRGHVLHWGARYAEADSAFASALELMPEEQRCRWRDMSLILDAASRREYARLGCGERSAFEERMWWLSDPLWMLPGNDRRTEHYSRRVIDSLLAGLPGPFDHISASAPWNAALSESLIRYGIDAHWINPAADSAGRTPRDLWAHYHTPNYHFLPQVASAQLTSVFPANAWRLEIPLDSTAERYRPAYDYVSQLSRVQVARFRRGESLLVAAAIALRQSAIHEAAPFAAELLLGSGPGGRTFRQREQIVSDRARMSVTVPGARMLASIEAMSHAFNVAGRTRFTIDPLPVATTPALSDLLLFVPGTGLPPTTADAVTLMHGSTELSRSEPLGVFWEEYGLPGGEETTYSVTLRPEAPRRPGFFGRMGRAIGIGGATDTVLVSWKVQRGSDAIGTHSVNLGIRNADPGKYTLEVSVTTASGATARATRELTILERYPPLADMRDALQQEVPRVFGATKFVPRVRVRSVPVPK